MAAAVALGTLGTAAALTLPGHHSARTGPGNPVQSGYVTSVKAHRPAPAQNSPALVGRTMASAPRPFMW
jgi:hypothetical protein